jgi:hypothetical protein
MIVVLKWDFLQNAKVINAVILRKNLSHQHDKKTRKQDERIQ